jgi:hypothetical protein
LTQQAPSYEDACHVRGWLEAHERLLVSAERCRLDATGKTWAASFPQEGGVYVVWEKAAPIYVGESSSLALRMSDIRRPVNHPFPKKVCAKHSLDPSELTALALFMSSRYTLSYIPVLRGRRELEDYLVLRWRRFVLNRAATRLLQSLQYGWVEPLVDTPSV